MKLSSILLVTFILLSCGKSGGLNFESNINIISSDIIFTGNDQKTYVATIFTEFNDKTKDTAFIIGFVTDWEIGKTIENVPIKHLRYAISSEQSKDVNKHNISVSFNGDRELSKNTLYYVHNNRLIKYGNIINTNSQSLLRIIESLDYQSLLK